MHEIYILLRELWLLWFMVLFTGIVVWAFWPSRRTILQDHANIPLRDDASPAAKMR